MRDALISYISSFTEQCQFPDAYLRIALEEWLVKKRLMQKPRAHIMLDEVFRKARDLPDKSKWALSFDKQLAIESYEKEVVVYNIAGEDKR